MTRQDEPLDPSHATIDPHADAVTDAITDPITDPLTDPIADAVTDATVDTPTDAKTGGLRFRAMLIVRRFWQPTSACMTCMPGSLLNLPSLIHWEIALRTGLLTGLLALLLSFTPFVKVFRHRYGNALAVACLTAIGDAYSHLDHYGWHAEALVTGAVAGVLTLIGSYLLEDRGRRVRAAWRALFP